MQQFDANYVRDVSEQVYRARLGEKDLAQMIEEGGGGDKGRAKVRRNAGSLDTLTRFYLDVLMEIVEPEPEKAPGV